jgi:hypothetical protein
MVVVGIVSLACFTITFLLLKEKERRKIKAFVLSLLSFAIIILVMDLASGFPNTKENLEKVKKYGIENISFLPQNIMQVANFVKEKYHLKIENKKYKVLNFSGGIQEADYSSNPELKSRTNEILEKFYMDRKNVEEDEKKLFEKMKK